MRDRDVRNAIQATLVETNAFDNVYVRGLPDDCGTGASSLAVATIEASVERADRSLGFAARRRSSGQQSRHHHVHVSPRRPTAPGRGSRVLVRHGRGCPEQSVPGPAHASGPYAVPVVAVGEPHAPRAPNRGGVFLCLHCRGLGFIRRYTLVCRQWSLVRYLSGH